MRKEPYMSNVKCQLFWKKIKDVYDSVLEFSQSTRQHSLGFTMLNYEIRPLLRQACRQWNQIPENIRKNFENITQSIQEFENFDTYPTNEGIKSTTTNPKPLVKFTDENSSNSKKTTVQLINSVYSKWKVEMTKDTYKSNVKCQLFLKKLKDVYNSVLKFNNITQQYSLDFTMSNDKTRSLLREACRQWNQIPENIRNNFENITQSIQEFENFDTYPTNEGIKSTTTNPEGIKTSSLLCELYTLCV
jgi:uncharacterized protein (UPF0147 family)